MARNLQTKYWEDHLSTDKHKGHWKRWSSSFFENLEREVKRQKEDILPKRPVVPLFDQLHPSNSQANDGRSPPHYNYRDYDNYDNNDNYNNHSNPLLSPPSNDFLSLLSISFLTFFFILKKKGFPIMEKDEIFPFPNKTFCLLFFWIHMVAMNVVS